MSFLWRTVSLYKQYYKIDSNEDNSEDGEEKAAFLPQAQKSPRRQISLAFIAPWALTAMFALLYASTFPPTSQSQFGSFDKGFITEFEPAFPEIKLEKVRFTSGVLFTPEGEPYRTKYPGQLEYVGTPTPELDENWEALIGGRYFSVTDEEAENIGGEENHKTWDKGIDWGYMSGFDVFHSLHCVNMVRKALDGDYYYPDYDLYEHHSRNHLDHCLDHLRQSLMCHGDLTPLTTIYWPQIDGSFAHSEQTHVCRNFQMIRDYTTSRYNGSEAVFKLSPEVLKAGKGKGRSAKGGRCPGCLPDDVSNDGA